MFLCISMCARAVGSNIESDVIPILDQMFSLGLSQELTNALKVLADEIPALLKEIQGTGNHVHDMRITACSFYVCNCQMDCSRCCM